MDSHVIIFKSGYGSARTHWQPIINATEVLRSLSPEERKTPGAGCDRAGGYKSRILQCLSPEEQAQYARVIFYDIRIEDDKPVFLLQKFLAGQEFIYLGRDVPDHKQRLLQQEIQKIEQHPQEIPTIELRPMEIPIIELHPRDGRGTR